MLKKPLHTWVLAICTVLLPFSAANAAKKPDLLSYIPEDSPYVIAMTKPFPKKVTEKFEPVAEDMLQSYQTILRHSMDEQIAKMTEEKGEEEAEKFRGLMNEITGLLSLDGLRGAGMETDAAFAFYGHGLLPVMRIELSDESLMDAAIARIEEKAESELQVAELSGEEFKFADVDKLRVIVATIDNQLILTATPTGFDDDMLESVLGLQKTRRNIKRAKTLAKIEKEYDYAGYMTGYVDTVKIASTFFGERSDIDQALFDIAMPELEQEALTDECKAEFMGLARIAPRMVFGYRGANLEHLDSSFVIELRDDIAAGMATLPALVPGLGMDPGGLGTFGFSLNPKALMDFVAARLDAIEADPYECEGLQPLQEAVPKGREMLAQPIPPVVYGFRGMVANISDVKGMDLANDIPPTSVEGSFLFAIENAQALLMMGAMFDPQIAALNLQPDGKPVEITMPQVAATVGQAFAAMTENLLSVAIGEGAESEAADVLTAKSSKPAPIMSMAFDAKRYYAFIGDAMMMAEADEGEEEMPEDFRAAVRDMMTAAGDIYDRMAVDVLFTERGAEFDSRITLVE